MIDESGVLSAGYNYVNSALRLYQQQKDNFNTLAEQNSAYLSILTKVFEPMNSAISLLSSGASLDLNTLNDTFTSLGLALDEFMTVSSDGMI